MSLKEIREGELKEVFDAMEAAFNATGTDFYIIGALARDIWYARGNESFRGTRDVDFALLVCNQEAYDAVRNHLKDHNQFQNVRENAFVMLAPGGIRVDILPFGEIEIDDGIHLAGEGLTSIRVTGFNEVYKLGIEEMELETGHQFKIATLPAIVLLKLIAFDDRPERREKDPRDIANIIDHFFALQANLIYSKHVDLFTDENDSRTLQDISSVVIGREIREICAGNRALTERIQHILKVHIEQAGKSTFIKNMVNEVKNDVGECIGWLKQMLSSITT